jgi:hypothetical protein
VVGKSEANIQNAILVALSEAGCLVFRQDTGAYKCPQTGRLIKYGLCKGSSDVIGVAPDGRFLAVEVKTATGRVRPEQTRFIEAVRAKGGRAGVARSTEDALRIAKGETE